jgi:hypothetical protein
MFSVRGQDGSHELNLDRSILGQFCDTDRTASVGACPGTEPFNKDTRSRVDNCALLIEAGGRSDKSRQLQNPDDVFFPNGFGQLVQTRMCTGCTSVVASFARLMLVRGLRMSKIGRLMSIVAETDQIAYRRNRCLNCLAA